MVKKQLDTTDEDVINNATTNDTDRYYPSRQENWAGLAGVILIPLFILFVAWGFSAFFANPTQNNSIYNPENGIGGGAPTIYPTISVYPTSMMKLPTDTSIPTTSPTVTVTISP